MTSSLSTEAHALVPEQSVLGSRPLRLAAVLTVLAVLAIGVRLHVLGAGGIVHDRQYRSALVARAYYYEMVPSVPAWRQAAAVTSRERQEPLEPQITERVIAAVYRLLNSEDLRIARVVCAIFWMVGAIPLFLLSRRLADTDAAVFATAFYLLSPLGVHLSVSILPESLMMTMLLLSLLGIVRYHDGPSTRGLVVAGLLCGAAILVKPFVAFAIAGAYGAAAIHRMRDWRALLGREALVFAALSLVPGILYYGYGIVVADYLRWKVTTSFLPHFLLSRTYWTGWFRVAVEGIGAIPMLLAVVGLLFLARGRPRYVVVGLWAGYVLFCLTFNYFVHFLPYYHAQLIAVVALSIGPLCAYLMHKAMRQSVGAFGWAIMGIALVLGVAMNIHEVRRGRVPLRFEGRATAAEIGRLVGHSTRVAYVAYVYGLPLEYYGELAGEYWPRRTDPWPLAGPNVPPRSIAEREEMLGFVPEYFVITNFRTFGSYDDDVREYLEARGRLVAETDEYMIYRFPDHAE
jgi:4-amino-4-deoxy-L-arabinose transferase-like glycosyltransferase